MAAFYSFNFTMRFQKRLYWTNGAGTCIMAPQGVGMDTETQPCYGIDAYLDWVASEGLPVGQGLWLDMLELDTADWPRYGVKGAVAHFDGRGDYCNMFKLEIPAGKATTPQRHLFEEVVY